MFSEGAQVFESGVLDPLGLVARRGNIRDIGEACEAACREEARTTPPHESGQFRGRDGDEFFEHSLE